MSKSLQKVCLPKAYNSKILQLIPKIHSEIHPETI